MENNEQRYRDWIKANPYRRPSPFAGREQRELYDYYCHDIKRAERIAKEVENGMDTASRRSVS